jgi:hypothetical protein
MPRIKDKGRIHGPFVPLEKSMLSTPAWKAMSFGARSLYVTLKGQSSNTGNTAYISYRKAANELGLRSLHKIGEWFSELKHYGFIVLHRHGSLGVEGKGKAPQWRLTEKSAPPPGELATRDYLRWDGVLFEPKRRPHSSRAPFPAAKKAPPMVNLDMSNAGVTGDERCMSNAGVTVGNGTVTRGGNTTVTRGGNGVCNAGVTGFCFSGVTHAGNADEHELASRFLAMLGADQR